LRNQLRAYWVRNPGKAPYWVAQWNPRSEDNPDAYIRSPEFSKILEIKAAEIIKST
jgi:hypothetical protein